MITHYKKCKPPYFDSVWDFEKPFEVRIEDGLKFEVGDMLYQYEVDLNENIIVDADNDVRVFCGQISYVLRDFPALMPGYVVIGLRCNTRNHLFVKTLIEEIKEYKEYERQRILESAA